MRSASRRPWWQQVTALVSVSAGGAVTSFAFVPKAAADATPAGLPVRLLALDQQRVHASSASETMLRSAVVNVANYYLRMAQTKTPAEMEAVIWQHDSRNGADHGESCAAFASLTLELGAQAAGQHSWVTGGASYPWPLHDWADVRVDPNPASPGVTSILQDAEAHHRWHPLGGQYQPQPGDWVLFDNHVEVVTGYSHGVLHTIGGDSLPNFSVNAHEYADPLSAQGVTGFVDNGPPPAGRSAGAGPQATHPPGPAHRHTRADGEGAAHRQDGHRSSVTSQPEAGGHQGPASRRQRPAGGQQPRDAGASIPGVVQAPLATAERAAPPAAARDPAIPGLVQAPAAQPRSTAPRSAPDEQPYRRHDPAAVPPVQETAAQQAFIRAVAPGAIAAQHRYGVPAAVTIAQAIDESGWGLSSLASRDHNLFGIKGTGPAGSVRLPTGEYRRGKLVTVVSRFRVYHDIAQSIDDHGKLLADSGYYSRAMARRSDPNAFASALTGVYATDPGYGSKIIAIMQRYDLYRYDSLVPGVPPARPASPPAAPSAPGTPPASAPGTPSPSSAPAATPPAPGTPAPGTPAPGSSASGSGRAPASRADSPQARIPGAAPTIEQEAGTPAGSPAPVTGPPPPTGTPHQAAPHQAAPRQTPVRQGPSRETPGPQAPPRQAPSRRSPSRQSPPSATAPAGSADIPGVRDAPSASGRPRSSDRPPTAAPAPDPGTLTWSPQPIRTTAWQRQRRPAPRRAAAPASRYHPQIPPSVRTAFTAMARVPLLRQEQLYRDVAAGAGIRWELLAACDWLQCEAHPRYSPVHGEKLGAVNADGTVYRTKSDALAQCAEDLAELAWTVYEICLTPRPGLPVRELASVFAAFRWGALLRQHHTSAMEFPYSVAGLTTQHLRMRWPAIDAPNAPDKPGARYRMPFGAVPIVLCLNYPATV